MAGEEAIKSLRIAWEILGVFQCQLEGWNQDHGDIVGRIGYANLNLARGEIMEAVEYLKRARKGVE